MRLPTAPEERGGEHGAGREEIPSPPQPDAPRQGDGLGLSMGLGVAAIHIRRTRYGVEP